MRHPCVFSLAFLVFTVPFALSGCGSTQMGSSLSGNNSQSGTPPTVSAVAVQVNGVAPNRKQEVQFSEAMDPSTINTQSLQVADSSGKAVTGAVTYDPDFNTASFQPSPALQAGASYTGTITTAASSAGGAHLAQPYTFEFTTRATTDTSPITVDAVSPTANATCVSATTAITVTFNESPDAATVTPGNFMVTGPSGAIAVKISMNVSNTQVVLTPTSALPSGTITVSVNNVADLAGVKMAGPYTWSFSTSCGGGGGGTNTFVYAGNGTNIAGFQISGDGSASAVPGSPFALAGSYLAPSPSGAFLFGDFSGTSTATGLTYYTYSVAADGSLSTASSTTQVANDPGTSTSPQWLNWIATDRAGTSLYSEQGYAGTGSGNQWMGEYSVGASGSLSLLTAAGARGASVISFTADDRYGFYCTSGPGATGLEAVVRNPDATLSGNRNWQPSLPAGAPPGSAGFYAAVSPSTNYIAAIFSGTFYATQIGIAVYPINNDGSAGTPTAFLPLNTVYSPFGVGKLVWDSTGTYLFASGAGGVYELHFDSNANTISLVDTVTVPGSYPVAFLNGHLFVVSSTNQSLYVYNFANGMLTPAPGNPIPLGFMPSSVAALQH